MTQYHMSTTSSKPIDVYPQSLATWDWEHTTNRLSLDLSLALDSSSTPWLCPGISNAECTAQRQATRHCPPNDTGKKNTDSV